MRRRRGAVVLVLAIAAFVAFPVSASAAGRPSKALATTSLIERVNLVRQWHGLAPLRLSRPLTRAATSHDEEMAVRGYFSHDSWNGASFSTRIRGYYSWYGDRTWSAGENLLWSARTLTAARAVRVWMHSPPHRANLLSSS